jgi:hypothetical protein
VEKGEGFRSTREKGGSRVGQQRGASPYPLSRQTNTYYCLHTHTHTHTPPHSFTLSFALLQQKNHPLPHPTFIQVLYIQTLLTTHSLPKLIKLSLSLKSLSLSLFFSSSPRSSSSSGSRSSSFPLSLCAKIKLQRSSKLFFLCLCLSPKLKLFISSSLYLCLCVSGCVWLSL